MAKKQSFICCSETINPLRDALDVFNGKWKIPIIVSVMFGNERFTDIQNSIPCISPKVLAKELKDLEEHQLIKRVVVEDYPVKILYKAEPYAQSITPIVEILRNWGQNHRKKLFPQSVIKKV
ncbi:helix-turn-helix domain-containing protein [Chryseobacterium fluminis]|uniref:winged helix-turn-helix transcriptional regulator n=1 Tax=Chryseobacterium fluminis TaxID=2983606 RepID=UPI002259B619|nr:helix-turn-helix domain-containing protein [Chryseobacterium sp. MMS21-Ot14]UZU00020.1 helix-turn-helix domain-containing protein [Chryseobacterium sp. MMS21-Ot14]